MRRFSMRVFGTILCAIVCGLALAGCSGASTPSVEEARQARLANLKSDLTAEDLVQDGTLTVGLMTDAGAPYVLETANGYQGIDVDVAAALGQKLGLQVKFQPLGSAASAALNRVDVVMGVTAEEAAGQVVASDYVEQAVGFFTLGDEPTVEGIDQLNGQTVGLQEGSASQQLLNKSNLTMTQQGFSNIDEAMEALKSGSVMYVLCPVYPGAYLADEMGGICFCGTLDVPTTQGVGVASGSQALVEAVQLAMDDIRDNGVLGIILHKWVGDLPRLTSASQVTGVVLTDASTTAAATPTNGTTDASGAGSNAVDAGSLPQETPDDDTSSGGTTTDGTTDDTTSGSTDGTITPATGADSMGVETQ